MEEMKYKGMTLNLPEDEMLKLAEMAEKKHLDKTVVIRQALKLYQVIEQHRMRGEKLCLYGRGKRREVEFTLL